MYHGWHFTDLACHFQTCTGCHSPPRHPVGILGILQHTHPSYVRGGGGRKERGEWESEGGIIRERKITLCSHTCQFEESSE